MKKLIVLILILVITSFIVVTNDLSTLENVVQTNVQTNPKNKNWEYVKDRLFDGQTQNVYKKEGPILILLEKGSKLDSLIVNEIIKELRTVIPNMTIDYFNNFTGVSYKTAVQNDFKRSIQSPLLKYKGIPFYKIKQSVIELNFTKNSELETSSMAQRYINYRLPNEMGSIRRAVFGAFSEFNTMPNSITFDINKEIPYKERYIYIRYELLRALCYIPDSQIINHYRIGNTNNIF